MRSLLQSIINALLSADADTVVGAEWGRPSRAARRSATATGTPRSTPTTCQHSPPKPQTQDHAALRYFQGLDRESGLANSGLLGPTPTPSPQLRCVDLAFRTLSAPRSRHSTAAASRPEPFSATNRSRPYGEPGRTACAVGMQGQTGSQGGVSRLLGACCGGCGFVDCLLACPWS